MVIFNGSPSLKRIWWANCLFKGLVSASQHYLSSNPWLKIVNKCLKNNFQHHSDTFQVIPAQERPLQHEIVERSQPFKWVPVFIVIIIIIIIIIFIIIIIISQPLWWLLLYLIFIITEASLSKGCRVTITRRLFCDIKIWCPVLFWGPCFVLCFRCFIGKFCFRFQILFYCQASRR